MERIDASIWMTCIAGFAAVAMTLYAIFDGQMLWAGVFCAETALGAFLNMYYRSKKERMRAQAPE